MSIARDTYHHGKLRESLLAAGLDLLDAEGVDAVTIRAVARRAGVAHSAPANHFKDKRALLTGLAIQIFSERADVAERQLAANERDMVSRIRNFARDWLSFGLAYPNRYRLIWRRDNLDTEDIDLNQQMDRIYDPLVVVFQSLSSTRPVSPETDAIALWSLLHGYLSMRLDGNLIAKTDERSGRPREVAILDSWLSLLSL